jgi:tRNA pseudouridine38-40 synthase
MARIALGLEYDGTDFVGWQSQRTGRTVQDVLRLAVAAVADAPVVIQGAGRTDTGVHAAEQVAHSDATAERPPRQWLLGINSNLPEDVAVRWVREVGPDFNARRSALWRRYRYRILQQTTRSALERRRAWWLHEPLDSAAMTAAAAAWLGERDFSAFRAAACQSKTPIRQLLAVELQRCGPNIAIDFQANAFLHHMVRNLVGVLVEIGRGRASVSWAAELLAGRNRSRGAVTAPPQGLTLVRVQYPPQYALPHCLSDHGDSH